jgi:hypothetical protein
MVPQLTEVQQRVDFVLGLAAELVEEGVGDFVLREQGLHFARVPLYEDVNGCAEVLGDVFGV